VPRQLAEPARSRRTAHRRIGRVAVAPQTIAATVGLPTGDLP
jgi:hypothetical protein